MEEGSEDGSEEGEGFQEGLVLPEVAQELLGHALHPLYPSAATAEPPEAAVAAPAEALEPPVLLFDNLDVVSHSISFTTTPPRFMVQLPHCNHPRWLITKKEATTATAGPLAVAVVVPVGPLEAIVLLYDNQMLPETLSTFCLVLLKLWCGLLSNVELCTVKYRALSPVMPSLSCSQELFYPSITP